MDRVNEYSQLIQEILERHARIPYSHGEIASYAIARRCAKKSLYADDCRVG